MRTDFIRNIGIMAHVDAGKTTLTEQLLYASGVLRTPGRVDHGTALTDSMEVEKKRGITVRAAAAALDWAGVNIRIIDTPGHADFYPEVERSIRTLDGVVLVISSVEGIQLQTSTIWTALRESAIPTLIFVNKLDRKGSCSSRLIGEMRQRLAATVLPLQQVSGEETRAPFVTGIIDSAALRLEAIECLAQVDQEFMDIYLGDKDADWIHMETAIRDLARQAKVYPVLFGAALSGIGVTELLDAIIACLPGPKGYEHTDLSALVFKVETDKIAGRRVYVRVFEGAIAKRENIRNATLGKDEKTTRILKLNQGEEYKDTTRLVAGDIGILHGLQSFKAGHVLGDDYAIRAVSTPVEPMLTARIDPRRTGDWNVLLKALQELEDEDPLLNVEWIEDQSEIQLRFFGEVQMEIIRDLLSSRFGLTVNISRPNVIYKETPKGPGEAGIKYRDGGYADLELRVEPLPAGSGFEYEAAISGDDKIYQKFMKQIPQVLEQCCRTGPLGWEVTDLRVTLLDGYCKYDLGTKHDDYKIVTPMVFAEALNKAGMLLLEPVMNFEISVPEEYGPQIYRDLIKMRASFRQPVVADNRLLFNGKVPFAETFRCTSVLYASSRGQGVLKTKFCGYYPVENT